MIKPKLKRLIDLDIAIGISIILVVSGHLTLNDNMPHWYIKYCRILYNFHMPLFMFFSGFLMAYAYKKIGSLSEYNTYIEKRVYKFVPAYIVFSLVFIGFEYITNDYSLSKLKLDVIDMLLYPSKAPAGFLWYIYVLFQFYLIFPILKRLVRKSYLLALALGVAFQFLGTTNLFNFDLFSFYLLFVILGIIATQFLDTYYLVLKKTGLIFLVIFIIVLIMSNYYEISKLLLGLFSIVPVHYIALQLSRFKIAPYLADLGKYSYYIYLMNTLVMGAFYLLTVKKLNIQFSLPIMLVFFLLGLFLPMVIYKKIIKPNRFLNKIIK
ncbi:MAG: fucose 4-O-acetylase-like acetyltransferase [Polaribacter sp.]|jgi:fucose 4-O-acetylase-like acetyltransferase